MIALACLAAVPLGLWITQSLVLLSRGEALAWQVSAAQLPTAVKRVNRVATYAAFVIVLTVFPLLRGQMPWAYYLSYLPWGAGPRQCLYGAAAAMLYLCLLYLAWLVSGNVSFAKRHPARRLAKRLAAAPLTAVLAALAEESLFRAVLLADLLRSLPTVAAVLLGVVIFAGAHYVRGVKRYWTLPGHLALGMLFCVAFVATGDIWLSTGLHAGGILVLMGARPFVRYHGPPWLVGASIFPYAGVVGIVALGLLTLNIWLQYGAA